MIAPQKTNNAKKSKPKKRGWLFPAGAIAMLCLLIGIFAAMQNPSSEEAEDNAPTKRLPKKTASPDKERTVISDAPVRDKWRPSTVPDKTADVTPPALTTHDVLEFGSLPSNCLLKASIFKHHSEGMIGGILAAVPGEHFLADHWDAHFDEDFRKSLEDEIVIEEDDSDEDRQLKEAVIKAKALLAKFMEHGERPSDIMREAQQELEKVTEYRDQLAEALNEYLAEKNLEDALAFCEEANKLLAEYNALPLEVSDAQIRRIQRAIRRKELEQ